MDFDWLNELSNFSLYLCFWPAALLNPRQFGLVSETPPTIATRSLIMIAKCLQNLANLVEFGGKVNIEVYQILVSF